jgi:succinate dehydrogenase / fumarate reductase cytochrome b subunit
MRFPTSTVGKKITMALTGQFMIFYVVAHVLGNYTLFAGVINAYAEGLRHWPYVIILWSSRTLLFISVILHTYYAIILKLENRKAKPDAYAITLYRKASFAGRTMIWSGLVIALFLMYHLLHFTLQVIDPSLAAITHLDNLGRPDVLTMVLKSFHKAGIAALYVIGVFSLGLHLLHGIESSIQTEGLNNDRTLPVVIKIGMLAAVLLFLAYATIPISIATGILKP